MEEQGERRGIEVEDRTPADARIKHARPDEICVLRPKNIFLWKNYTMSNNVQKSNMRSKPDNMPVWSVVVR